MQLFVIGRHSATGEQNCSLREQSGSLGGNVALLRSKVVLLRSKSLASQSKVVLYMEAQWFFDGADCRLHGDI